MLKLNDTRYPRMNRFGMKNSVLLIDNCPTHFDPYLREICISRGILLLYLPPYSPDYAPIEIAFSMIKGQCKRHRRWMTSEENVFHGLKMFAAGITAEHAAAMLTHCEYE
jgi:transposase